MALTTVVAGDGLVMTAGLTLLVDATFATTGVVEVLFPESVAAVKTTGDGLLAVVEALLGGGTLLLTAVGGRGGLLTELVPEELAAVPVVTLVAIEDIPGPPAAPGALDDVRTDACVGGGGGFDGAATVLLCN